MEHAHHHGSLFASTLAGFGLAGLRAKLAEHGLDWATLFAGVGSFAAFMHSAVSISREARLWLDRRAAGLPATTYPTSILDEPMQAIAAAFAKVFALLVWAFARVPGSVRDHLNVPELLRVAFAAATAGGGVFGVMTAIVANVGTEFPSPADAAMATVILTAILDVIRRLGHGTVAVTRYY